MIIPRPVPLSRYGTNTLDLLGNLAHYRNMTHSPVILQTLKALFTQHFMGDSEDDGAWRIVPRGVPSSPAISWYENHATDNLRHQFWSKDRNGIVCTDEVEARALLVALEAEFVLSDGRDSADD